jgi:iron complex outermembrane recepter protein
VFTGEYNPNYNAAFANSPALIEWMRVPIELTRSYEYVWFDALLSGETGISLPGGNIAVALGLQGRYSSEEFLLDDLSNRAVTPCATIGDTTCTRRTGPLVFGRNNSVLGVSNVPPKRKYPVAAAFFEMQFPILDSLSAQLAGRYEKFYSDISDKDNDVFVPAVALKWQPLDWLGWRASAGQTFSQVNPPIDDGPTVVASVATNTALGGIAGYSTRSYDNVDVKPMESQYFSTGFLFNEGGLSASVDYWYINIDDYTRTMTANQVINALRVNQSGPALGTDVIDCASGLLSNPIAAVGGVPFVQLAAPCVQGTSTLSSAFVAGTTVNFFGAVNETNAGYQRSSGIDLSAKYRFDDVFGGTLTPSIDGTYNLTWELGNFEMGGSTLAVGYDGLGFRNGTTGRIGVPIPEYRGSFGVLYNHGRHTLNVIMSYIPSVVNEDPNDFDASNDQNANIGNASGVTTTGTGAGATCTVGGSGLTSDVGSSPAGAGTGTFGAGSVNPASATPPRGFCGNHNVAILSGRKIESSTNVDLTYRVELNDMLSMSFTVYNLLDEKPSFDRATVAYNSGFGSPLERNFKLGFQAKF